MKKTSIIILSVLIVIALFLAYWLLSPLFMDREVSESLEDIVGSEELVAENETGDVELKEVENGNTSKDDEDQDAPTLKSQGEFVGQAGHEAEGTVSLIRIGEKNYVRFEDDFDAENGPDFFVHLGSDGEYDKDALLGGLKGNIGGQNYEIPDSINIDDYNEVWIWCRAFFIPFARAELN